MILFCSSGKYVVNYYGEFELIITTTTFIINILETERAYIN